MAWKMTMLLGLGAGYVLGARAGRQRYEQIAATTKKVWRDPRVQEKAEDARTAAGVAAEQAGGTMVDKAAQAQEAVREQAARATAAMKEKVGDDRTSTDTGKETGKESGPPQPSPDGTGPGTAPTPPGLDADLRAMGAAPVTPGDATAPRRAPGAGPGSGASPSAPGEFDGSSPSSPRRDA